jgi:hypothetical protein
MDVLIALAKVLYADKTAELSESKSASAAKTAPKDHKGEEIDPELEAKYKELAVNMAVVDMRDGYILKIAPVSPEMIHSYVYSISTFCSQLVFALLPAELMDTSRLAKQGHWRSATLACLPDGSSPNG